MVTLQKASVTLGGVALSGISPIVWRFQTGTTPYTTTFTVSRKTWESKLRSRILRPQQLVVVDSRGAVSKIKKVYILHEVASDSPNRRSFLVADRRWRWDRVLIARDYNIPKKTGDRDRFNLDLPIETEPFRDKFDFKPYSLHGGESAWTPKQAITDILEQLEPDGFVIESVPRWGIAKQGLAKFQNVYLRDQGNTALARMFAYIPGAAIYIDAVGVARVFDATSLPNAQLAHDSLPPHTWDGDKSAMIDRKKLRPKRVKVHYQREVELVLDFQDDYREGATVARDSAAAFVDNVIPTVDPETLITDEYDPVRDTTVSKRCPPGTYVTFKRWLAAMDLDKPVSSSTWDWTFETIKLHWVLGKLDGALGGGGKDLDEMDEDVPVSARIQALKRHFRQTFRINRNFMEQIRDIQAIRVAVLDPVTGAHAPAAVWGQSCMIPPLKGQLMAGRSDPGSTITHRNLDYLALSASGKKKLVETAPGPARIVFLDRDQGIFRIEWILGPFGTVGSYIPCNLAGDFSSNRPVSPRAELAAQDRPGPAGVMGVGLRIESGANFLVLRDTMRFKAIVTIVPAAPNNKKQFHIEDVPGGTVSEFFGPQAGMTTGDGPPLEVFVPPNELTSRFAIDDETVAETTVGKLLGLRDPDPRKAGIEGNDLPGYQITNARRELPGHSESVASEQMVHFADSLHGRVTTRVFKQGIGGKESTRQLGGNMSGVALQVSAHPTATVSMTHEFPGKQVPINRFGILGEEARRIVLGIVAFGQGDK